MNKCGIILSLSHPIDLCLHDECSKIFSQFETTDEEVSVLLQNAALAFSVAVSLLLKLMYILNVNDLNYDFSCHLVGIPSHRRIPLAFIT